MRLVLILCLVFVFSYGVRAEGQATPNDIARFISGLQPSPSSPLTKLTERSYWKRHASSFDRAWGKVEAQKLIETRAWARQHLKGAPSTLLYMFSGPDFLYADTFYPNATTYVLSALEPVGKIPNIQKMSTGSISSGLQNLRASMNTLLSFSFFKTADMKEDLKAGFKGTIPVLFAFLTRTGKSIKDVSFHVLQKDGHIVSVSHFKKRKRPNVVKIDFTDKTGVEKTLYYFSTDLANYSVKRTGFLKFCEKLGASASLVKSASYLMHMNSFSTIRDFILKQSTVHVQDDSGIPVRHFDNKVWALSPFGRYKGPIPLFKQHYQKQMARLFKTGNAQKVKFGIGYRWRVHETNILLAKKR